MKILDGDFIGVSNFGNLNWYSLGRFIPKLFRLNRLFLLSPLGDDFLVTPILVVAVTKLLFCNTFSEIFLLDIFVGLLSRLLLNTLKLLLFFFNVNDLKFFFLGLKNSSNSTKFLYDFSQLDISFFNIVISTSGGI